MAVYKVIEKFKKKWGNHIVINDGAYKSRDFINISKDIRKLINSIVGHEIKLENYSVGHYTMTGFLCYGDKYVYFSISDIRGDTINKALSSILVRTATGSGDYLGGENNYTNIENFNKVIRALLGIE